MAVQQGRSEVRDAKNNEAHGAMKKERHVCARRRVGEQAVSEGARRTVVCTPSLGAK
jgi:hypothetical protein